MVGSIWYPAVDDVIAVHDDIVAEYPDTSPGVRNRGDVEFVLEYIENGVFGTAPETIHEKAFHLLRLLVANHPFVDGNKRTALNTTVVFYFLNGHTFDYDDEIRQILRRFGTDQATVDETEVVEYLRSNTDKVDLQRAIAQWRDELIKHGLDELTGDSTHQND